MPLDPTYKPYKPTGNIAVDLVAECINTYHVQFKKIKVIRLDPIHWQMFKGFVMEKIPAFSIFDHEIDFDGVIVTQQKVLSNEVISWEFEKPATKKMFLMN